MQANRQMAIKVRCPDCGELTEEPLESVAQSDVIPCSLCGGLIDLTAEDCRAAVLQAKAAVARGD